MDDYLIGTYMAFAGAFFAYLFIRFAEFFGKLYDRRAKHYGAVVRLNHTTNLLLDEIGTNLYLIDQIILNHAKATKDGKITVTGDRPRPLNYEYSILYDIYNLDLINEIFSYYRCIERFNQDAIRLGEMYDFFKNAFIQDPTHKDNYMRSFEQYVSDLKQIRPHLFDLLQKTKRLSAIAMLRGQRDRPMLNRFINCFIRTHNEKMIESDIKATLADIESDIEMVRIKSQAEIDAIDNKIAGVSPIISS